MGSDVTNSADSTRDGLSFLLMLLLVVSIQLLKNGIGIGS